jgi:hypothetical protein
MPQQPPIMPPWRPRESSIITPTISTSQSQFCESHSMTILLQ